jgi:hypothetical protein
MFVFTDDAYQAIAGVDEDHRGPERVVGFTFVDPDAPSYWRASGKPRKEYEGRFGKVMGAGSYSEELLAAGAPARLVKAPVRRRSDGGRHVLVPGIDPCSCCVLRVSNRRLIPLNVVLGWAQLSGYRPTERTVSNRRARRWVRFADRVVGLAPLYVVAGVAFVVPALIFGIPSWWHSLWPNWRALGDRGLQDTILGVIGKTFQSWCSFSGACSSSCYVCSESSAICRLGGQAGGAWIGNDLVATFMRNPQEPAWAGAGGEDVIIRMAVPKGWSALRSTDDPGVMAAELEKTRVSVGNQLELAGLGSST